jgi:hypothetical protein
MLTRFKTPLAKRIIVASLALLWNAMTYFLIMEQMDPVASQTLTDDYRTFIATRYTWELAAANLTYITGFVGIALLLLRRKEAVWAFGLSALTAAVTVIPTMIVAPLVIGLWMLAAALFAGLFARFAQRATA